MNVKFGVQHIVVLALLVFVVSCQKDDNSLTPKEARDRFVGNWLCEETSPSSGTTTYDVRIKASSTDDTRVDIENFAFTGPQAITYGYVNGNDLDIPGQVVSGFSLQGSGEMPGSTTINMQYSVDDGSGPEDISAVFTRK